MKTALEVVNKMHADGVIGQYAIGGATGALFYIEAVTTIDVDIFTYFKSATLDPLREIFEYLGPLGYAPQGEFLFIAGTQVQFLPADADLLHKEAVDQSLGREYKGVATWVMTPEHLMAIALKLGRHKDLDRVDRFLDWGGFDVGALMDILERHKLMAKWESFMLQKGQK